MLVSLMYFSKVSPVIKPDDIANIFKVAHNRNADMGLSGILYSDGKWFIQVLEGMRYDVSKIYNLIQGDKRHTDITLVSFRQIEAREYSDWAMGFIKCDLAIKEIILEITGSNTLVPLYLDFDSINKLLGRFADSRLRNIVPHFRRTNISENTDVV